MFKKRESPSIWYRCYENIKEACLDMLKNIYTTRIEEEAIELK